MNEYVRYSELDKQYDAQLVFSISLYKKHVQKYGGRVAPNSI